MSAGDQGYRAPPGPGPAGGPPHQEPWGLGFDQVCDLPGGRGQGATLWVVERGWHLAGFSPTPLGHPALQGFSTAPVWGENCGAHKREGQPGWADLSADERSWRDHGLSNLGVWKAAMPGGLRGVAPEATIRIVSVMRPGSTDPDFTSAIRAAVQAAAPGDVLLVEDQVAARFGLRTLMASVAAVPTVRQLFAAAIAKGVLPIASAGNGDFLLAPLIAWKLRRRRIPLPPELLIVGGADPSTRQRAVGSNFGPEVNCFAWGKAVATLQLTHDAGYATGGDRYDHGGTSSAAALVAGAALVARGMALARGRRLGVAQLKALLLRGGTPTEGGAIIGLMPNLEQVAAAL